MAVICPTVTANDPQSYREQMARIEPFAQRIHIDLSDGQFTPEKLLGPAQVYWPQGKVADLHVMYKRPQLEFETLVSLKPNLVIIHAEADGDVLAMLLELQSYSIKAGIALLAPTLVQPHADVIGAADHILLFAGNLGHQGGEADMNVLKKVPDVRVLNPTAELAWDGGIRVENVPMLQQSGIEVLNVGGFIQAADDALEAYKQLSALLVG
jgi:ribulose-phosphate 3-epimerase